VNRGGSRAHAWIRHRNRAAVLAVIRRHGQVARPTIERETTLAFPTVVQITNALLADGMVSQAAVGASTGGRRPGLLALRPEFGHAFGVRLQNGAMSLAVVDFAGSILAQDRIAIDTTQPDTALRQVAHELLAARRRGPFPGQALGVGLAVPGVVDMDCGVMRRSPPLGWAEVPIGRRLRRAVGGAVWVDNDVNVLAQDQALFGVGQQHHNFLVVTVGRGVGLGVVQDGHVYHGTRGGAAELGHLPWFPFGAPCTCGRSGCLETGLSDAALTAHYAARGGVEVSIDELARRLRSGDPVAALVYSEAARELARAIGGLVTLFAPEAIVLSGEGVGAGPRFTDEVAEGFRRYAMEPQADDVRFLVDDWDDGKWARGAASLVFDHVFFPRDLRSLVLA
jgi:N-acetylglucosamine repressor